MARASDLEMQLKSYQEKYGTEISNHNNLKLSHSALIEKSNSQESQIAYLNQEIERLKQELSDQYVETEKYKIKKNEFKQSSNNNADEILKLKTVNAGLEKRIEDLLAELLSSNAGSKKHEETIDLLESKLKETSSTLISNNSTIDELKKSLAEAQKYSFRAILNNRSSAHHPV